MIFPQDADGKILFTTDSPTISHYANGIPLNSENVVCAGEIDDVTIFAIGVQNGILFCTGGLVAVSGEPAVGVLNGLPRTANGSLSIVNSNPTGYINGLGVVNGQLSGIGVAAPVGVNWDLDTPWDSGVSWS